VGSALTARIASERDDDGDVGVDEADAAEVLVGAGRGQAHDDQQDHREGDTPEQRHRLAAQQAPFDVDELGGHAASS